MIVAHYFDGDDDEEVAQLQQDVYGEALGIMVARCNEHARFARGVLNDTRHHDWGTVYTFEHHTLQNAHTVLAAAWRFRNDHRQPELPYEPGNPLERVQRHWLDWLNQEVADWTTQPNLIRLVQLILTNQNDVPGFTARAQLGLELLGRFSDVPWNEEWYKRHRKVLAAHLGQY